MRWLLPVFVFLLAQPLWAGTMEDLVARPTTAERLIAEFQEIDRLKDRRGEGYFDRRHHDRCLNRYMERVEIIRSRDYVYPWKRYILHLHQAHQDFIGCMR